MSCAALLALAGFSPASPNVVLILVDDLGFSDLGCYGGEIDTPNIDRIAHSGVRYTQFYTTGRCSPTRASLLTGLYSHRVGIGQLPSHNYSHGHRGEMPGYSGWFAGSDPQLPNARRISTLPELLGAAGYQTSMCGKWHLTRTPTIPAGPNGVWPTERGFSRFYGTMEGAKDYFAPKWLVDSETPALFEDESALPSDYFYTRAIAQRGARLIRDSATRDAPFFHYQAFYAPHFPLQAPAGAADSAGANLIAKYQSRYRRGWDRIRQERFERQLEIGLWEHAHLSDKANSNPKIPEWDELPRNVVKDLTLRMAVYAAQVEIMDQSVGVLLEAIDDPNGDGDLRDNRWSDTTVILLSDNGAVNGSWGGNGDVSHWASAEQAIAVKYGAGWANVSNTPFRHYKGSAYEGGLASPLIVCGNAIPSSAAGKVNRATVGHVIDLLPTVLELGGIDRPDNEMNLAGVSLVPSFAGNSTATAERSLFFEHEGHRAARVGSWKMVARKGSSDYALYDLAVDRAESNDLSSEQPETQRQLRVAWERWAERNWVASRSRSHAGSPFLSHEAIDWLSEEGVRVTE